MKIAPSNNGLFVYAATKDEPNNQQLLFCNTDDGSITTPYTLPDCFLPNDMITLSDGSLIVAGRYVKYNDAGAIEWIDEHFNIYHFTETNITHILQSSEYMSLGLFNSLAVDEKNERLYILVNSAVVAFSLTGELLFEAEVDGLAHDIIFSEQTDTLYVMITNAPDMKILVFRETENEFQELTRFKGGSIGAMIHRSDNYCFYIEYQNVLFGYDKASNSFIELFHLSTQGISGWIPFICQYKDNYIVLVDDIVKGTVKLLEFKVIEEYDGPVEIIKLGKFGTGRDLLVEAFMADFNFFNPQYIIQIIDYSIYDDDAVSMLHMDVIKGDAPDIFLLAEPNMQSNILPIFQYISGEKLLNIAPYMERDLDFDTLWSSALQALYIDNACYFAVPSFTMHAIVGKSNVINELNSNSINTFFNFLKTDLTSSNPNFVFDLSQSDFVVDFVLSNINEFVNYNTGEAYFDLGTFSTLLEAANEMTPINEWDITYFSRGLGQATTINLDIFGRLASYGAALNNDFMVTGFPGEPTGVAMIPRHIFGISSATEHTEGAWAFLREMYENENLHENREAKFTMNKMSFDNSAKTYIDVTSRYINEHEEGYYISSDDFEIFVTHVDPLDIVNKAKYLIEKIDRIYIVDYSLINIIMEELPAFFTGNKTAESTTQVIQSRAQTYLWELK